MSTHQRPSAPPRVEAHVAAKHGVGLVIAAAGGEALGGTPKQVRPLCGKPVLVWTIGRFIGLVDEIVVVTSADLQDFVSRILALEQFKIPHRVVLGGASRLESVAKGVQALSPSVDKVLVHDAARPLVKPENIQACIAALDSNRAAVLSAPATPPSSAARKVTPSQPPKTATPSGWRKPPRPFTAKKALRPSKRPSMNSQIIQN